MPTISQISDLVSGFTPFVWCVLIICCTIVLLACILRPRGAREVARLIEVLRGTPGQKNGQAELRNSGESRYVGDLEDEQEFESDGNRGSTIHTHLHHSRLFEEEEDTRDEYTGYRGVPASRRGKDKPGRTHRNQSISAQQVRRHPHRKRYE